LGSIESSGLDQKRIEQAITAIHDGTHGNVDSLLIIKITS
jgi:hypothetical protein